MDDNLNLKNSIYVEKDLGVYLIKVYAYMALGCAVTGIVAYGASSTPSLFDVMYEKAFIWGSLLALFILIHTLSTRIHTWPTFIVHFIFWLYATLIGLFLTPLVYFYPGANVARIFLLTSSTFAAMSAFGYNTKADVSSLGSFMLMGLFSLILASLAYVCIQRSAFDLFISVAGVLLFVVLTAIDIQKIKDLYFSSERQEITEKKAIKGALTLYLNYMNLLLSWLYPLKRRLEQ
jgi:FtsH-binding integral membrane protein